ncbi:phosphatase PAP2 family protein [Candidatus Woesearchaeota archaeon]|nr:phosphatase PAP2 family protein [Candidatus Woesearchaeota archaeon]
MHSKRLWQAASQIGTPPVYITAIVITAAFSLQVAAWAAISVIAVEIAGALIKLAYPTERPKARKRQSILQKIDSGSFPSIHTARVSAFAATISLATVSNMAIAASALLITAVGVSRIRLRHHYLLDVLGGGILGVFMAVIVFIAKNGIRGLH